VDSAVFVSFSYLIVILGSQDKHYFEEYALSCSLPHVFVMIWEDYTLNLTEIWLLIK
jgi:hypothetical protein